MKLFKPNYSINNRFVLRRRQRVRAKRKESNQHHLDTAEVYLSERRTKTANKAETENNPPPNRHLEARTQRSIMARATIGGGRSRGLLIVRGRGLPS